MFALGGRSALTGLELTLRLVDHVDAALAAHNAAVVMAVLERAERVGDFHVVSPDIAARERLVKARALPRAPERRAPDRAVNSMVGGTGIEPVAPTMST